ncbi:hypothetical protein DNU06_08195 [Putridiphycobacter roseus]|uniref:Peptidase S8 n=1 Tax=Putridiphycobacter roseus TaxID=2219161 RepID=A0A2W1N0I3_9FLAO|nr:S8 family serine peptidase [Putridiphycobacter roseus]PZE17244.1 hypothetical protein DNU06_08195 [Putridiphycobacter roseus]
MMRLLLFLFYFSTLSIIGQEQYKGSISFQKQFEKAPELKSNFAVKGDLNTLKRMETVHYKYTSGPWHYIYCTSAALANLLGQGGVSQVYFPPSIPKVLNDSMRLYQNVDSIFNGNAPLQEAYTGKGVIVGYVDTGIDFEHEDFKNPDGSTRVIAYWDQALPFNAARTPIKYGYGQVWSEADINNGNCTSTDNAAHGSTVSGAGSGNGLALNKNRGVAPASDLVIIETSFSLPNWTLTVADAIDFVFHLADSLNKPAVINTSVGDYLGSHDGSDPASVIIDSLLHEKPGRIVVAAAGNSGNWDHYHVRGDVTADTTFTWLEVNPSSAFGVPAVFMDVWADSVDFKNVKFGFGANDPNNNFITKGKSNFYDIQSLLNTTTLDSIMIGGAKATPIEFSCEEINGLYHIEIYFEDPDSLSLLYSFLTVGSGTYDLWSGFSIGLSKIRETNLPTAVTYPAIQHYQYPDSLISTVSSWACSEQVITVANYANQLDYIDQNGNTRTLNHTPGKLSINSSKGPNRIGEIKPDISATGDGTLSSCPQYLIDALIANGSTSLQAGKKHVLNGGTSMASPVIAGIAALYLEKCNNATNIDFKNDLISEAHADNFTESTPNFAYGYGKIDAFKLLNKSNFSPALVGDTLICEDLSTVNTAANNYSTYMWSNGSTKSFAESNKDDTLSALVTNSRGCRAYSDTLIVVKGTVPMYPEINNIGGGLVATPAVQHQWYFNNVIIPTGTEQYYNPVVTGYYYVKVTGPKGCYLLSDSVEIDIEKIKELEKNQFIIFPNPFIDNLQIIKKDFYTIEITIVDAIGRKVYEFNEFDETKLFASLDLAYLTSGIYLMKLKYNNSYKVYKIVKE